MVDEGVVTVGTVSVSVSVCCGERGGGLYGGTVCMCVWGGACGGDGEACLWQRCWGNDKTIRPAYGKEGDGKNDDSLKDGLGAGTSKITALKDTAVMFVEVTYHYQPLVSTAFFTPPTIRYESAFNTRAGKNDRPSKVPGVDELSC